MLSGCAMLRANHDEEHQAVLLVCEPSSAAAPALLMQNEQPPSTDIILLFSQGQHASEEILQQKGCFPLPRGWPEYCYKALLPFEPGDHWDTRNICGRSNGQFWLQRSLNSAGFSIQTKLSSQQSIAGVLRMSKELRILPNLKPLSGQETPCSQV